MEDADLDELAELPALMKQREKMLQVVYYKQQEHYRKISDMRPRGPVTPTPCKRPGKKLNAHDLAIQKRRRK